MSPSSKPLILLLVLAALVSLSCQLVTGMVAEGEAARPTEPAYSDPGRGALVFKPATLPEARVGTEYRVRIVVEGARTPVGDFGLAGELPPGLKLEQLQDVENTAEISGTPIQAGSYSFGIEVWCYGTQVHGQTGDKAYILVVK